MSDRAGILRGAAGWITIALVTLPLRSSLRFYRNLAWGAAPWLLTLWSAPLLAAEPWLRFEGSPRCASNTAELAVRIEEQIAGVRNLELSVEVGVRDRGRSTIAEVRVLRRTAVIATKELVAPTCDEAREAVAAVIALALSAQPPTQPVTEPLEPAALAELPLESRSLKLPTPPLRIGQIDRIDRGVEAAPRTKTTKRWAAQLSAGIDAGTLQEPTALAGAGLSANFGATQLRGSIWYGLPSSREEVSSSRVEASRAEFAATRLELCQALDSGHWLSLCAGTEARLTRLVRKAEDGMRSSEYSERFAPGVGAGAGARFIYCFASLQPELAVTAELPLLGTPSLAERPILRATVGAVLPL